MKWWTRFAALALLALAGSALAGSALAQQPQGALQAGSTPLDPEFGVRARHGLGLQRQVRMYQWRRDGKGYERAWVGEPVDSAGFAPGHRNPPSFPLQSRRWIARDISFDGRPLAPEVVSALGQWQALRPDFSALPGNLAVTFQPEGDGLGSAVNPLAPKVGDLRIHWRELALPPLAGKVELRDGRWQLLPDALATATTRTDQGTGGFGWPSWPWWLAALALAIAGAWLWRRKARH